MGPYTLGREKGVGKEDGEGGRRGGRGGRREGRGVAKKEKDIYTLKPPL